MMTQEMNILLVEDNDLDIELLKRGLRKIDSAATLVCAKDGIEALKVLEDDLATAQVPRPFVILLDVNMPRMNGHEFLKKLRATQELRDLQVFMFTTSASKKDVDLAYHHNASGYIVKPNSLSELAQVLTSLRRYWSICEIPSGMAPGGMITA